MQRYPNKFGAAKNNLVYPLKYMPSEINNKTTMGSGYGPNKPNRNWFLQLASSIIWTDKTGFTSSQHIITYILV